MNQLKVQIENYKNTWKEPGYKKVKMYTLICWLEKIMKYIAGTGSIVILIISFRNLYNIFTLEIKQSSFFMLDASKQAEFTKITEDMGAWIGAFAAFVFLVLIAISLKQFIIPKVSIHGAFFTDKAIVEKPNFRVKETRDVKSDLKSLKLRQIVICFIGIGSIATPTTLISNFACFSEKTSYFLIFTLGTLLIFQLVKHFILKKIAKEFHYGLELLTTEKDFVRLNRRIGSILNLPTHYLPFLEDGHVQLTHELLKPTSDNQVPLFNEEDTEKETDYLVKCMFTKEYQFVFSPIRIQYELPIYYFKNKTTLENHENSLKELIGDKNYKKLGCFVYLKDKPK
ncbi:hypothetical protein CKN63_13275 [Carnobacterium divergens]|uniref:hypothetical protein n=1 Tax=Carnobacterium divergens TaxID=2748 RepID=UPI001071AFB1|nr:hypothetical protein [Carnobacterium divergens]TFI60531.1 hypothetical protein CKN59_13210 [Carnobacterium divergens]TFI61669.1 hypothetical protein CKN76_12775 [Carnobacterium divergens]TFJ01006.1 hypothetical protein CKN75_12800 [Carnobacterium divergens]TFJ08926.1 hypothetical protein CKN71_12815 [Carnobacterium divergens]TFJ15635.1 hypothetical protein CKN63_13275 [Carnobacterium divergens]